MTAKAFGLGLVKPLDASAAFASKTRLLPSFNWDNVYEQEHAAGVAIAGVTKLQVLQRASDALQKAIDSGYDMRTAKAELKAALVSGGYWGNVELVNPTTGERRIGKFNESRLDLILNTNIRAAQAAGQWQRGWAQRASHPYVVYLSQADDHVRPLHRLWHGTCLPAEHPFWLTHCPPCGWRCRCRFMFVSEKDIARLQQAGVPIKREPPAAWGQMQAVQRRMGDGSTQELLVPVGIDPGFEHNPGISRLRPVMPAQLPRALVGDLAASARNAADGYLPDLARLSKPTPVSMATITALGLANWTEQQCLDWAMGRFGQSADGVATVTWPGVGEVPINQDWFTDANGQLKIQKEGRHLWLPLLVQTLQAPDQIRAGFWRDRKATPRYRLIKRFEIEETGEPLPVLGVFEWDGKSWAFEAKQPISLHTPRPGRDADWLDLIVQMLGGTVTLWTRK